MSNDIVVLASQQENFQVTYATELLAIGSNSGLVERKIAESQEKIETINSQLQQKGDAIDYTVAVACGILTGLLDTVFVGDVDLVAGFKKPSQEYYQQAKDKVNDIVIEKAKKEKIAEKLKEAQEGAKKKGKILSYEQKQKIIHDVESYFENTPQQPNSDADPVLRKAIRFLEKKHPALQDNVFMGKGFGVNSTSHHLDDIAHHPTLTGLVSSIVIQFFRAAAFVNKDGKIHIEFIKTEPKDLIKIWGPVLFAGLANWLVYQAEKYNEKERNTEIPKPIINIVRLLATVPMAIEILKVANNWCCHLLSDIAGSNATPGAGMGIPGLFVSFLKEISSLPIVNKTGLPNYVNKLFVDNRVDFRNELGCVLKFGEATGEMFKGLIKQSIPVIINEVLVRGFFFIRHLILQIKETNCLSEINWNSVIPFKNRVIIRMMAIASGTFTAFDLTSAAITSSGNPAAFVVKVNFVGLGRFVVAVGTDVTYNVSRKYEIQATYNEMIALAYGNPLKYFCNSKWITLDGTETTFGQAYENAKKNVHFYSIAAGASIATAAEEIGRFTQQYEENRQIIQSAMNKLDEQQRIANSIKLPMEENQ